MTKTILAAGTVCWRRVPTSQGEHLMVLLIHRTKQGDVSFPKGKLDPGESMPQTAVRETLEETGLDVRLGAYLGAIEYTFNSDKQKTVQYWAAEVTSDTALASTFTPGSEVQALEWVSVEEARKRLSYKADRKLYDVFLQLADRELLDSFAITLLRHAKAEPRSDLYPEDRLRPLTDHGDDQAEMLVPTLTAFGPRRIYSSTAKRCLETVAPVARHLKKRVREKEQLSQDFWDAGDLSDLRSFIGKLVKRGRNAIVCSHRPVLPDLARELVLATGSIPGEYVHEAAKLPPGGFSVFHFSKERPGAGILGVETYPIKP